MKTGRYSIAQLLTSSEVEQIIIPELQRDYVWGKRNVKGLLSSILDNYEKKEEQTLLIKDFKGNEIEQDIKDFLNEEYMRLRYNTRVGFIYAYHDRSLSSQFYLIDGQQRITTIFLILLALYRRTDTERFRKMYFVSYVPKIDYKVREVAHDFLIDFIEYELTKNNPTKTFKGSSKYYREYDKDITAQTIYTNYYDVIVPALDKYDNVETLIDYIENYIEFNYFDTNISEQGEKLYLYMNSRGESLSVQERIKSIIVGRSQSSEKLKAGRCWEDWQNFFWRIKPQSDENADRGFYEFLKWTVILHVHKYTDTKIKKTQNTANGKSRIEEIKDYIRIERDESSKAKQADWIFTYISDNENFTFDWLKQIETAVELMYILLQDEKFKEWNSNIPWFSGCDETIEYVTLLGLLYYIVTFKITINDKINALRVLMYLKNLKSEYTLRRNPDRAVIRILNLIDWMSKNKIMDIRMAGMYAKKMNDSVPDKYVLRVEDLRWGYFLLDWQDSQHINPQPDTIGKWESFFWQITNSQDLNRFLRGNHDFIVKIMQYGVKSHEEFLDSFKKKIYEKRYTDDLRKELLKYGDISVYDEGGSNNIGNWMERWCLLKSERDEPYWDTFMNGEDSDKNARIVASYLLDIQNNKVDDPLLAELGNNLKDMEQKYYLWSDGKNQRTRIILLEQKQASKTKSRELCVQYLHKQIANSWIWEHNYCVINIEPMSHDLNTNVEDKNTGYYIDLWYDWKSDGGKWYCRIGHKEHDLPDKVITAIQKQSLDIQDVNCNWIIENSNRIALRTKTPIYTDKVNDDYFAGANFVKNFFDEIFKILRKLNANGIM